MPATAPDLEWVRREFPALSQSVAGNAIAYFDGPGGTQVPQSVIEAIGDYLARSNANVGGRYLTSERTEAAIRSAREAIADLLGCDHDEVVLGANMTTLTFAMSRAIGRQLGPGDEIVVTRLDHDANFAPWKALEETGASIRVVDIDPETCTLDLNDLEAKISSRTKVVALGYSSNLVGTINDVARIVEMAHVVGAMVYVDAVHYAPHHFIDVRRLDCDFLVCSSYKFFGSHMGALYGKREHLERLRPYKLRASSEAVPDRWNTGTLNHECAAAIPACVEYLASIGRHARPHVTSRRTALQASFRAIEAHEQVLFLKLIQGLSVVPGITMYGVPDSKSIAYRSPTCALSLKDISAAHIATELGKQGIFVGSGHFYALNLAEALGVAESGVVRIGIAHYNTSSEVDRLVDAIARIAAV